jgi:multisubunit Na+/H+ antiporter MnhC subunit
MSVLLALVTAGLFGCGVYMLLSRHVVRMVLGLSLLTTAVNLAIFQAGRIRSVQPPLIREGAERLGEAFGRALGADVRVTPRAQGYKVQLAFDSLDEALEAAERLGVTATA